VNVPTLSTATPEEFGGPGDAWSPELLLLGAVESCFLFTFRAVAHASKLAFDHVRVNGVGVVDREDRVTRFTEIELHVTIGVPLETDVALVERLAEKAERACLVTASLSTQCGS
jgi:peroxiredoxin-like protein